MRSASLSWILTILLSCFAACGQPEVPQGPLSPPSRPAVFSYLALGDSYTIGEAVAESLRWPVQLVTALSADGTRADPFRIIARTGWTTADLQLALAREQLGTSYDLVSLLIGVNNQYRRQPLARYRQELSALLDSALQYTGGSPERVFVLSIPDWGVTPFGQASNPQQIAVEIDQHNAAADSICRARGIRFFNITPISREAAQDPSLVAPDGLHPSGKMYARWVELILPAVEEMLF
jgi:lysophospholipase L1-like esterase